MKPIDLQIRKDAAAQVIQHGRFISDVAKDFGITNKKLYQWLCESTRSPKKKEAEEDLSSLKLELSYLATKLMEVENKIKHLA